MEIINLTEHIEKILPTCTVIVSQPTLRTDNVKANNIIGNLNIKLKRNKIKLLDNSNIKTHHLGKKGLHLNAHGTRRMAMNIISLIKRF